MKEHFIYADLQVNEQFSYYLLEVGRETLEEFCTVLALLKYKVIDRLEIRGKHGLTLSLALVGKKQKVHGLGYAGFSAEAWTLNLSTDGLDTFLRFALDCYYAYRLRSQPITYQPHVDLQFPAGQGKQANRAFHLTLGYRPA